MRDVFIVSAVRTAVGKAYKGTLAQTRPDEMAAAVIKEAVERVPALAADQVQDVILGCAMPEAEQGLNVGRASLLRAGLPYTVPGYTLNRFCASGLEAIHSAALRIQAGEIDVAVAGGTESMSLVPMGGNKPSPNPEMAVGYPELYIGMGLTAERLAEKYNVTREDQDEFSMHSHKKAADAIASGRFSEEIVPLTVKRTRINEKNKAETQEIVFDTDDGVRADTTVEALSKLKPAFKVDGTVTAGNSSQMSDGAAAVVLVSDRMLKELVVPPIARLVSYATAGVPPEIMGIGPVDAVPAALEQAGLTLDDIGVIELNEAFAAQALAVQRTLEIPDEKLNVNGGAVALGHPLGCTGAKLTVSLLHEMRRRDLEYGIVTMCVGGGMGAAGVFQLAGK
ncbi:MAG: thiolase family protein [Candidatus Latescibacterota bacterium]|jgi:acetyl-CoA acyltransferase